MTQVVRNQIRTQGRCFGTVRGWYKMSSVDNCFSDKVKSSDLLLPPSKTITWFSPSLGVDSQHVISAISYHMIQLLDSYPPKIESRDWSNICKPCSQQRSSQQLKSGNECSSTDELMNKVWCMHTTEYYYSAIERHEILTHATT